MKRFLLLGFCLTAAMGFAALGLWQLERRAWKHELVALVASRIHAEPAPPPPPARWPMVNARDDEYRRLLLAGSFRHDRTTMVDALTERGPGRWVITPLVTRQGTVLVNRGFVPTDGVMHDFWSPRGVVTLTGLLRLSEPGGRFLRPNRPQADRWYSRDVAAIAAFRKLGPVAPFFIDAEASPKNTYPVGGLTVVRFRDAHLTYALTWLALAGLAGFGAWRVIREPRR